MKIDARQRWAGLIASLAVALGAVAWVSDRDATADAELVEVSERTARPPETRRAGLEPVVERLKLEKLRKPVSQDRTDDAFAPRSWHKPRPKPPAAVLPVAVAPAPDPPPAPPSAPPLPYVYMGKMLAGEARTIYLTQGERNLIAHQGDTIDAVYRVENVSDSQLTFVHLPTGTRQSLQIGESQ